MRKRDGTKQGRLERASLMPSSARGDGRAPSVPAKNSWSPPTSGGVVRARMLDDSWDRESAGSMQIPVSPSHPPATRASMIPKAPPLPRISVAEGFARESAGRPSLPPPLPSTPPKASQRLARTTDSWDRYSLTPSAGVQSLAPPRYEARETEDRRYQQALFLREQGRTDEALRRLDELVTTRPDHDDARLLLLKLALERQDLDRIEAHAQAVVLGEAQRNQQANVCALYKSARMTMPQLAWSERCLLAVLLAADRAGEGRVVVDVTKMLLHGFPQSPALPRALYASAAVQHHEGRPDLARATLHNLVSRFPRDSLVPTARRRLDEIG